MVILYILGLMGWVALVFIIFGVCFHDYTKDEKGKNTKDKIDDWVQI
ncbi:hypothetical protein ES705_14250 [subsurface metagenome]